MKNSASRRTMLTGLEAALLTTALSEHAEAARTIDIVKAMSS